ncbi:predicted protein [Naegleria gruberi]|uniref:Predicted protein n=1 Tax=Naegleria gruberi TaxID=5762 RepID=D2VPB6_NAEGR|nr:uncharacterized protein NAEGRDRAFT_70797 [Naegleria gruberi]EFC41405.1 predicted protein [Naegleria gruberi]|eukprot:XP_002674149.1 predicted protein [Naegleria gruberi strain NEG-M]
MPPKQAQKSPRHPQTVKPETTTPKAKKSSKDTITTPKTTPTASSSSAKAPKPEKKTSATSTPSKSIRKSSSEKTEPEKEKPKGILKKASIQKIAKIHGCKRISADVYEKAREMFDQLLGELMRDASIITQYNKKKQITFQTINQCSKRLWNITVYNGTTVDAVKDMAKNDDSDYSTDYCSDADE